MTTLVYLVGPGAKQEPLRYSLRSVAAHLPVERVILAGHCPDWATGVDHMHVPQARREWSNQLRILRHVVRHKSTPREFVLMNDDFFLLSPQTSVPLVHGGPLSAMAERPGWRHGWYARSLRGTLDLLAAWGVEDPVSYDGLHQPMPVERDVLADVLARAGGAEVQHRSLYGNVAGGGELADDVKIRTPRTPLPDSGWASCSPRTWPHIRRQLAARFGPCRHEAPAPATASLPR